MRRFTPLSSSSILILSLSVEFVVKQGPINAWRIFIVLWRYSDLPVVKLPAHRHTKTSRITENHSIKNFRIKEMSQILYIVFTTYTSFFSLYFSLFIFFFLKEKGMLRDDWCSEGSEVVMGHQQIQLLGVRSLFFQSEV
jgi:hypothetical protein